MDDPGKGRLGELARLFLRLGAIGFGGPAAHMALMEEEVVRRRGWLTHPEFLDLIAACNLIPGPNSTELAIHIGHRRAGWRGLLVAGACFIAPAVVLTLLVAWAYVRFGALPRVGGMLSGVAPVIVVIVLQALWTLGRRAVRSRLLVGVTLAAIGACVAGVNELLVLFGAGALVMAWRVRPRARGATALHAAVPMTLAAPVAGATPSAVGLTALGGFFLKAGAVLFGSGYVLLAFLRADLVERRHWLTERQLLDAIAAGQITPGPVFSTATFIGYVLAGVRGATVATLGIFLPAFAFVAASGPLVPRLRRSPAAGAFLDGVNAASLALMAVVTWHLGRAAIVDAFTVVLAASAAIAVFGLRVRSVWLVLAGALAGVCFGARA